MIRLELSLPALRRLYHHAGIEDQHVSLLYYFFTRIGSIFLAFRRIGTRVSSFEKGRRRRCRAFLLPFRSWATWNVENIGCLDERFFMFFSDVDWCRRFVLAGKKIFFLPEAKIVHHMGHSIFQRRKMMIVYSHTGFFQYFLKYYRGILWFIPNIMIFLVLSLSALLRIIFLFLSRK